MGAAVLGQINSTSGQSVDETADVIGIPATTSSIDNQENINEASHPPSPIHTPDDDLKISIGAPPSPPSTNVSPVAPFKTSLIVQLAQTIAAETAKVDAYLRERGDSSPNFGVDGIIEYANLRPDIHEARHEILRATAELRDLVQGPKEKLRWLAWDFNDQLSLSAINHFNIPLSFPLNQTATFASISEKVGVDEMNVRRLVRHAMTNRIFTEVSPGVVAHTAASRVLAEDAMLRNWIGMNTEDIWPSSAATVRAMDLNPGSQIMTQSGFQVAFGTIDVEPFFVTLGRDPARAKRFGTAMASLTGGEGFEISYLVDGYAHVWEEVNAHGGTLVDLGGSHGFACVTLAEKYEDMKFVVQDLPKMIASAPDLGNSKIKFVAHDFYDEQPIQGADVYFFRWIFHNQSDLYALSILRSLIPALNSGSRIIINDNVLPDLGQDNLYDEKVTRSMDLVMLSLLNAQERTADDFRELFEKANEAEKKGAGRGIFKFVGAKREKGCRMSVVEAIWEAATGGDVGLDVSGV